MLRALPWLRVFPGDMRLTVGRAKLLDDAASLAEAGAFAVVLELVAPPVSKEITDKFPELELKSADLPDVPDSRGLQAFSRAQSERFPAMPQRLVNHVGQGVVNHAGECRAGYLGLTRLFKAIRSSLG